jgi:hypothetical protein
MRTTAVFVMPYLRCDISAVGVYPLQDVFRFSCRLGHIVARGGSG